MTGRRVVFVVGCPRSGTTLVQQLLNAHPAVLVGPETFFVRRYWLGRESSYAPGDDEGWEALLRDVAGMPELEDVGLSGSRVTEGARELERRPAALLGHLLERFAGTGEGVEVVGEKTPNHALYMPLLGDWFPEARFVHLLRDPRAVAASWRTVPWSSGSLCGDAAVWRRYVATALDAPEPERRLDVRYEALVTDTEPEARRLCAFLGIPFHDDMLRHHRAGPTGFDPDREPWKRAALGPVTDDAAERWRGELSPWQVLQVEATVGDVLEAAGYAPTRSRFPRATLGPPLRALAWLRRRIRGARERLGP